MGAGTGLSARNVPAKGTEGTPGADASLDERERAPPPGRGTCRQETLDGPDHQHGRTEEVDLDQERRKVGEVLGVSDRGLGHHYHEKDASGPAYPLGDVGHVERRRRGRW